MRRKLAFSNIHAPEKLGNFSPKQLPRYLAEFCHRHNRRFQLEVLLLRFVYVDVRTPPMPGRLLKLAEAYG
jgi:hypothetical protein